jgi:hypothetical protein
MSSPRPPVLATWMLRRFTSGPHSEAFQGDLFEAWRGGCSAAWYWRQVLIAVAADLWRRSISANSLIRLGVAVAALSITALLAATVHTLVPVLMRFGRSIVLANREKWWWPLVRAGLTYMPLLVAFLPLGIALHRRRSTDHDPSDGPRTIDLGRRPKA